MGISGISPAQCLLPDDFPARTSATSCSSPTGLHSAGSPGDSDVPGRNVVMNGRQVAIVGVLPEHFRFHLPGSAWPGFRPREVEVYEPIFVSLPAWRTDFITQRGGQARRPGATLEGARAEIEAIRRRIEQAHPNRFDNQRALRIISLHTQMVGRARWALLVLLGAVGFVLLIACANTANLLLARNSARRREIAVRMAVGAGRARVLRQLLVESLVLAALGSAAGLLLARLGVAAILEINPQAIPRLLETTIDGRVPATVLGTSILTAIAFGLAPAATLWKTNPHDALKSGNRMTSPGTGSVRTRKILVGGEVALALTLLIGAGLMVKSAWRMHAVHTRLRAGARPDREDRVCRTTGTRIPSGRSRLPMRCSSALGPSRRSRR